MTDRIEPALSADQWAQLEFGDGYLTRTYVDVDGGLSLVQDATDFVDVPLHQLPALIALANAALPDSDPRKITRAMVEKLDYAARLLRLQRGPDCPDAANVDAARFALESYLPPE